jgi:soluble lytic murein transglycosylase
MGTLLGRPDYRISRDDLLLLYPRAWQQELDTAAMVWGVPPEIMAGLARSESAFRAEVASHAGAVGLVQIMPATGRDIAARIAKRVPLVMNGAEPDLTDAFTNTQLGAWYLADWTERLSSPMLALFAYNAGPGRVRQWRSERSSLPEDLFLETVPFDETRNYGRRVLSAAAVYGYLYYGYDMSQVAKDLFGPGTDFSIRSAE